MNQDVTLLLEESIARAKAEGCEVTRTLTFGPSGTGQKFVQICAECVAMAVEEFHIQGRYRRNVVQQDRTH